jgi:hypothetical protein
MLERRPKASHACDLEAQMTYIPHGPKKPVELMLSADLIEDAEALLGDVSAIVEKSLCRLVQQEKQKHDPDYQRRIDEFIKLANEFEAKHGVWGAEFSTL